MLTGKDLGRALETAMRLKGVTPSQVAREFEVKGPSVHDWLKHGRIGKRHLDRLLSYFADVVPATHWGISNDAASLLPAAHGVRVTASPEERVLHLESIIAALCVWIRETIPTGVPSLIERVETASRLAQADPVQSVFGVALEGLGAERPSPRSASRGGARSDRSKADHP